MRITLAQLNYHVGNFEKNSRLIIEAVRKAERDESDLIIFSELSLTGYPPLDLLERRDFIDRSNSFLDSIAAECINIAAIVGAPAINKNRYGKKLYNAAYVLAEGKIQDCVYKSLLPTYDIFDEYRYFEPSADFKLVNLKGKKLAITICEDLWDEQGFENEFSNTRMYTVSPMDELAKLKPDIIINISASPYSYTKIESKEKIFTAKAKKHKLPLFMVNQVGANTDLIFEGNSMVIGPEGNIVDFFPPFREYVATYDVPSVVNSRESIHRDSDPVEMIYEALVLGLKDYFDKMGFKRAILGLSGGIDSAVCLCIASRALGPSNVRVLMLPSMYSSEHSVDDAVSLCDNLDVKYDVISIEEAYRAIEKSLGGTMQGMPPDVTEENIQARIRSLLLMAVSNKFGNILLNTSNKSEAAVGYGTLYGDMAGSISVLGDVYKTDIYRLAEYINKENKIIPDNTINKPPSAELRPGQKDTDSLPDYKVLDSILYQYIELQKPPDDISGPGIDTDLVRTVIKLINKSEFKRFQAPPILRISSKAFGRGRRLPLVGIY